MTLTPDQLRRRIRRTLRQKAMTRKLPPIKPLLMWAIISKYGAIMLVMDEEAALREFAYSNESVRPVLVCAPPKRRKRK